MKALWAEAEGDVDFRSSSTRHDSSMGQLFRDYISNKKGNRSLLVGALFSSTAIVVTNNCNC